MFDESDSSDNSPISGVRDLQLLQKSTTSKEIKRHKMGVEEQGSYIPTMEEVEAQLKNLRRK